MSQPYVGQIIMMGCNFAPNGWMTCAGQTIAISQNSVLFQLIGTTYGGDGETTFNLPDLRGRVPVHMGTGPGLSPYVIGQNGGTEQVTLTTQQIPQHSHAMPSVIGTPGNASLPNNGRVLADEGSTAPGGGNAFVYTPFNAGSPNQVTLPPQTISNSGGNQPHENRQPILTINYVISLFGVFPSQS